MSVDYLTEDTFVPDGQNFVCISYLSDKEKTTLTGIKIRGVFQNYEDACEFCKKIQSTDSYFDVYVGEMGKWLPIDPDPEKIKDNVHANDKLNEIMLGHIKNQEKTKLLFEQRKNELMRENIINNLEKNKENLNKLKEEDPQLENNINVLESQIKEITDKKKNIDDYLVEIEEKISLLK